MKKYERGIEAARKCLDAENFERADRIFDEIFSEIERGASGETWGYVSRGYRDYVSAKKEKLLEILDEVEVCAGLGDFLSIGGKMSRVISAGGAMESAGHISSEEARAIAGRVNWAGELLHHIVVPLSLAAVEIYHEAGDKEKAGVSLSFLREYAERIGVDCERSVDAIYGKDCFIEGCWISV